MADDCATKKHSSAPAQGLQPDECQLPSPAVNTNFTRVDGPFSDPPLHDVLVVNHYILRSREEFQRKLAKAGNAEFPGYTWVKEHVFV